MNKDQNQVSKGPPPIEQFPIIRNIIQKIGKDKTSLLLVFLSSNLFPISFIYCSQNNMSSIETNLGRGIAVLFLNMLISRNLGFQYCYRDPSSFRWVNVRSIGMVFYNVSFALCHFYISLPIIHTINCSGPLFILIMDYIINKTQVTKGQIIGTFIGMFGLTIAVNGEYIKHWIYEDYQFTSEFQNYSTDDPFLIMVVVLFFIFGLLFWAYAVILTKKLKLNLMQINISLGITFTYVFGLLYFILVQNPVPLNTFVISLFANGLIFAISTIFFIGGVMLTKKTGRLTIILFWTVVTGYICSVIRYNQTINMICISGDIILVIGVYKVIFSKA